MMLLATIMIFIQTLKQQAESASSCESGQTSTQRQQRSTANKGSLQILVRTGNPTLRAAKKKWLTLIWEEKRSELARKDYFPHARMKRIKA